jgi:anhydro-N-acetylmuramic acid kinase
MMQADKNQHHPQAVEEEVFIGLMSGTSLDGCDAALVRCRGGEVRLASFVSLPMPDELKADIQLACSLEHSNVRLICALNARLGAFFAQAAQAVCKQAGFPMKNVTAIISHGQTIWHIPPPGDGFTPSTLQIGEPAVIAYQTGVPVVSGMRAMDMAAGGQGAPLVPLADYLLYRGKEDLALQNLGGIGNVTLLPANCDLDDVFAFDTGPGNMILDGFARHLFGLPYDRDGLLAKAGTVNQALLNTWMALPYIDAPAPKSTGRELFGEHFIKEQLRLHKHLPPKDLMATAAAFTAHAMRRNYELYIFPRCPGLKKVVLSGGGAYNPVLKRMIADLFPECGVLTQEDLGWSSDAKEAVAFALIGRNTLRHHPGNVPSATGARLALPLGSITWPAGYEQ